MFPQTRTLNLVVTQFEKVLIQTTKTPRHKEFTKITLCYSVTLCLCGSN